MEQVKPSGPEKFGSKARIRDEVNYGTPPGTTYSLIKNCGSVPLFTPFCYLYNVRVQVHVH